MRTPQAQLRSATRFHDFYRVREWYGTLTAMLLAIGLVLPSFLGGHFDLVRLNLKVLSQIEKHQFDDFLAGFAALFAGVVFDWAQRRKKHHAEIDAHRRRVLKATMRTVQDIVNNFLNNLQLFRLEADESISVESSLLYDQLIMETAEKLRLLADLDEIAEKQMAGGWGIEYDLPLKLIPQPGPASAETHQRL